MLPEDLQHASKNEARETREREGEVIGRRYGEGKNRGEEEGIAPTRLMISLSLLSLVSSLIAFPA